jgi:hypothetical protein
LINMINTDICTIHRSFLVPKKIADDGLHLICAVTLMLIAISCFVISIPTGVVATLVATIIFAIVCPTSLPAIIVTSFLYQNTFIAVFWPLLDSNNSFDELRGANFVILTTATSVCILAWLVGPKRLPLKTRKWLFVSLLLIGIIVLYLGLGAARGEARDAIIYFRNTVTPIACFSIGLVIASYYSKETRRAIIVLGIGALIFGYCELFFGIDFLSVFNGDEYIKAGIIKQIKSGYWERVLQETGFVLINLEDVLMTSLFNISGLENVLPKVLRLGGPNFHPISFAYAIAIISIWLTFNNRFAFLIAATPILVIVGSKGAIIAVIMALAVKLAIIIFPVRIAILGFLTGSVCYIVFAVIYGISVNDFHVLGLLAGLRDFANNPAGQGLGFGGNLSSTVEGVLDWSRAQDQGIADIPVESAVGVMLYQMGIMAFVFFGFLAAIAHKCVNLYFKQKNHDALCGFVLVVIISTNGILQEEAFFSPLALGFALLLVGICFGRSFSGADNLETAPYRKNAPIEPGSVAIFLNSYRRG